MAEFHSYLQPPVNPFPEIVPVQLCLEVLNTPSSAIRRVLELRPVAGGLPLFCSNLFLTRGVAVCFGHPPFLCCLLSSTGFFPGWFCPENYTCFLVALSSQFQLLSPVFAHLSFSIPAVRCDRVTLPFPLMSGVLYCPGDYLLFVSYVFLALLLVSPPWSPFYYWGKVPSGVPSSCFRLPHRMLPSSPCWIPPRPPSPVRTPSQLHLSFPAPLEIARKRAHV